MTEVEQLARRFSAQLDAKSRRLERLTAEADERIEALLKLQDPDSPLIPSPAASASPGQQARPQHPVSQSQPPDDDEPADPLAISIYELADQGLSPEQIARKLGEHAGKVELILALRTTA
jgi:hypothetical protein